MEITFNSIGKIIAENDESSVNDLQKPGGNGKEVIIELEPKYTDALDEVDGFEYVFVIFHFHKNNKSKIRTVPRHTDREMGVFATRSPSRPNNIGLSVVKVVKRERNKLFITDADMINGTPVLDIKPYIPDIDAPTSKMSGWIKGVERKF